MEYRTETAMLFRVQGSLHSIGSSNAGMSQEGPEHEHPEPQQAPTRPLCCYTKLAMKTCILTSSAHHGLKKFEIFYERTVRDVKQES